MKILQIPHTDFLAQLVPREVIDNTIIHCLKKCLCFLLLPVLCDGFTNGESHKQVAILIKQKGEVGFL